MNVRTRLPYFFYLQNWPVFWTDWAGMGSIWGIYWSLAVEDQFCIVWPAIVRVFLRAYDSFTGQMLWRAPLPVVANATPMTYVSHGRQYVVIAAGGHVSLGTGKSDQVVAFALPQTKAAKRR